MGAPLGGAFGGLLAMLLPSLNLSIPAFAIIGMVAMVGGGTGAAMTAVTIIFEMTRDYEAAPLYSEGMHANKFLVHQARDVMDHDILLLPSYASFEAFFAPVEPRQQAATRSRSRQRQNRRCSSRQYRYPAGTRE